MQIPNGKKGSDPILLINVEAQVFISRMLDVSKVATRIWVCTSGEIKLVDEYTQADCIRYGGDCRVINDQDGLEESL